MKGLLLLTFIICYLCVAAKSSEDDFTCIAGNFTRGQSGNVTCHFGPKVHNKGYHFEIVKYPLDAPLSHSGEDVLRCHRNNNDQLSCTTGEGFVFNKKIQDNLTVTIPKVTVDQAGRYTCQLIPPDDREKRLCDLNVKEVEVASSILRQDSCSEKVLVLAVLVGFLLVCCLVLLYMNCRKRRRKKRRSLSCFRRIRSRNKASKENNEAEVRQSFIMPPIIPYTDSDLEDEPEEENQNTNFDGDDEDAREPFKITILPYNDEDDRDETNQIRCPPAVGRIRYPHRDPYHRV